MAKKKPAKNYTPTPPKAKERKLYQGESVSWMDMPNNLMSVYTQTEEEHQRTEMPRRYMWPLVAAAMRSEEYGNDTKPIFVDDHYDAKLWEDWVNNAPTWMDPHLFLRMAVEDERVQKILRVSFKKNDPDAWSRLLPLFQEILDTRYLPYVIERFERDAAAVMAHWLIRNNAQECLDEAERQKELARRRRQQ